MLAVDICNSLADIDSQLKLRGITQNAYPAPLPECYFTSPDGMRVFRDAEPIEHMVDTVKCLALLLGGVTYVTSRPIVASFVTRRWLKRYGFPAGDVMFCQWHEKASIYMALKAKVIIEDDPRVLEAIKDPGALVLVPQWPYNQHLFSENLIQVKNWGKAAKEVELVGWR